MDQTIKSMYEAGHTLRVVGQHMGFCPEVVRRRLLKMGVKRRKAAKPKGKPKSNKPIRYTNKVIKRMAYLYVEERKTLLEVGEIMHASHSTVRRVLTKAGVELRKAQRRSGCKRIETHKPRQHLLCEADMLEAAKDKLLGLSWREIGEHYKVSRSLAYYLVKPYVDRLISS